MTIIAVQMRAVWAEAFTTPAINTSTKSLHIVCLFATHAAVGVIIFQICYMLNINFGLAVRARVVTLITLIHQGPVKAQTEAAIHSVSLACLGFSPLRNLFLSVLWL